MFEPGQLVLCVDDSPGYRTPDAPLVQGRIYTVSRVAPRSPKNGELGIDVAECPAPRSVHPYAWRASRFRPLRSDALDVFRQALEPAPKQTEAA